MDIEAFEAAARRSLEGDEEAARAMLADPEGLKAWLDKLARRGAREGLAMNLGPLQGASARPAAARFLERGMPATEDDLKRQYHALAAEGGPLSFKEDLQSIERAILAGSSDALREIARRSPMALWAMDFSLAEYEDENALAFAAKYAPSGADLEVVAALREIGARLPPGRLRLPVGAVRPGAAAAGVWAKPAREVADALEAAGYVFGEADGFALLGVATFERQDPLGLPEVALQKVAWLDEIERRAGVDWTKKWSAQEIAPWIEQVPLNPSQPERNSFFLKRVQEEGAAGLGAWVGMQKAPLRCAPAWAHLGRWLDEKGLILEAARTARETEARDTLALLAPWEQQALLRLECGPSLGAAAPARL